MTSYGRRMQVQIGRPGAQPRVLDSVTDDGDTGLYITARTRRTADGSDDTAEVEVWGLAPQTVALLQDPTVIVRVLAGYGDEVTEIASGRVLPNTLEGPRREADGSDWRTAWQITDGGLDIRDTVLSETWVGATDSDAVFAAILRRSGLTRGTVQFGRSVQWSSGYVISGTVRDALDRIAAVTQSVIAIQGGTVQVWPVGGTRQTTATVLRPDTGLMENPEPSDDGVWTVRCDLLPGAMPGDSVVVESDTLTGTVTIASVEHDCDSAEGPYATTLQVQSSGATVIARAPSLASVTADTAKRTVDQRVRVARAARVVSYDAATQRCDVQYIHSEARTLSDGSMQVIEAPKAYGLPVAMMSGGGRSFTFGLSEGDRVWVLIRDLSGDEYDAGTTSGTYAPQDPRRYDLADGVVWPMQDPPSRVDGQPVLAMGSGEALHIGDSTAALLLARADLVLDELADIRAAFNGHTHTPGGYTAPSGGGAVTGVSGGPDTSYTEPGAAADIASDRVKVDS